MERQKQTEGILTDGKTHIQPRITLRTNALSPYKGSPQSISKD